MRVARLVAVIVAVVSLAGAAAPGAAALTRTRADRLALRALRPAGVGGAVVVYGLPAPVRAGTVLLQAGPGAFSARHFKIQQRGADTRLLLRVHPAKLKRRAWLFWEDLSPGTLFAHPSVLLAMDARSGRVLLRKKFDWEPLVNGRPPAFLRSVAAYRSARYRIYARGTAGAAKAADAPRALAALAPNLNLSGVCLFAIGATKDPLFKGDLSALRNLAATLHLQLGVADSAAGLALALNNPRRNCTHVALFVLGHGMPPLNPFADGGLINLVASGPPCVTLNAPEGLPAGLRDLAVETLCADKLKTIISAHPKTTFDVQILSCYGGRFVGPLSDLKNVASVGVAAGPNRFAQGHTDGTPSDFIKAIVDGVVTWANSPTAVQQTGGDITGALENADEDYDAVHLGNEPEYYDSVHGKIIQYDPAHPDGQELPASGGPGTVRCDSDNADVQVEVAAGNDTGTHGQVTVSPPGESFRFSSGSDMRRFCYRTPITVTVSFTPDGGYRWDSWSSDRICDNDGSNRSQTCRMHFPAGINPSVELVPNLIPPQATGGPAGGGG